MRHLLTRRWWHLLAKRAAHLKTSETFLVESAIAEMLKDELPTGFVPGMPFKENKEE
jgi:hypothetical protein